MDYDELYQIGKDACVLLLSGELEILIRKHPYALAFERNQFEAFVEDYAKAKAEIDFVLGAVPPEIEVSQLEGDDLVSLIEISLQNPDLKSGVKLDLVLNRAGVIYVEDVFAYFETH